MPSTKTVSNEFDMLKQNYYTQDNPKPAVLQWLLLFVIITYCLPTIHYTNYSLFTREIFIRYYYNNMCQYYEITWKQLARSRSGDILDLYIDLWQSRRSIVGERVQNCQKNLAYDQVRNSINNERKTERETQQQRWPYIKKEIANTSCSHCSQISWNRSWTIVDYLFLTATLTTDINNNINERSIWTTRDKRIKRYAQVMSADDTHHFQMFERRQDGLQIADDRHYLLAGQGLAAVQQVHHLVLEPLHRGGNR